MLAAFEPDLGSAHLATVQKAVFLTRLLQKRATELQPPQERREQAE